MKWKLRGNASIAPMLLFAPCYQCNKSPQWVIPCPMPGTDRLSWTSEIFTYRGLQTQTKSLRHQQNRKEGQQNDVNTRFILPNKKTLAQKKKKKSSLNTIVLPGGGDLKCNHFNEPRQLPMVKQSSEEQSAALGAELQGALSLGNRIIIKQVTSGTCFSPRTSGKHNCVSVNDGWVFAGLAAGPCARCDWLAGAGRSLSAHFSWPEAASAFTQRCLHDPQLHGVPGLAEDMGNAGSNLPKSCLGWRGPCRRRSKMQ